MVQYTETVFDRKIKNTLLAVTPVFFQVYNTGMGYADNIVVLRKRAKFTQAKLAELLGVEQPTVQRWETGKREPTFSMMTRIAQALNVEPSAIINGDAFKPLGPQLFIKGRVAAGVWNEAFETPECDWETFTGRDDVTASPEHRFGLRIDGDSMNLRYPHGSIVECVSVFGKAEVVPGKRVVVLRRRDDLLYEATVKKLVEVNGEKWLTPESTNPAFESFRIDQPQPGIIECRIIAVVVGAYISEN